MKKILGFSLATVFAISFLYVPAAFADAATGKKIFNTKTATMKAPCKQCHKPAGDPAKFKPVGPGLKGVGKRLGKEYLQKWLSPKNVELWGDALGAKGKITVSKVKDENLKDLLARYKAAKKGKDMKKSQMVKNFAPGKGGKPPKITMTDEERNHVIDYLMTL